MTCSKPGSCHETTRYPDRVTRSSSPNGVGSLATSSWAETPSDLTWIDDFTQHKLLFDHDDNPLTADVEYDTFAQMLTAESGSSTYYRTDFRFGVSPDGFLLISSKQTGAIYIVSNVQQTAGGCPGRRTAERGTPRRR